MLNLICKKCGKSREKGRRYCSTCHKQLANERAKIRYKANGRWMCKSKCIACGKIYDAFRHEQKFCSKCWKLRNKLAAKSYDKQKEQSYGGYSYVYRRIVEKELNRKIATNEVVHHLDGNSQNNELTNLMILTRTMHGRLHKFLDNQRVIIEKSMNENSVNCWNNLIVPMTTTWLETANVKVIKIWEIGQSAAKPLSKEEGSETIDRISNKDNDIVQTTT